MMEGEEIFMRIMRKFLSMLLVIATVFYNFAPTFVLALENIPTSSEPTVVGKRVSAEIEAKGNIEIETHLVLPVQNREDNDIVFTIYDSDKNKAEVHVNDVEITSGYKEMTIELGNQKNIRVVLTHRTTDGKLLTGRGNNIVYISINLYAVNKGTYTLEFSGKHFVTYDVDVTLDENSKRVQITDEKGLFEIGEISGDGVVDEKDATLMLEAIKEQETQYDLNLDGIVDIADLNYITAIINGTPKKEVIEDTNPIMSSENVSFESTGYEGDLGNIFADEGKVTLKPANTEEAVSDDNPIDLTLDLGNDSEEAINMSEVRIAIGEDNAPTKMKLYVEEADGTEHLLDVPTESIASGYHLFTEDVHDHTLKVNLGKQMAVKKVTIRITETSGNNLADIAKVEFLNNVKMQAKEPDDFYTPKNIQVDDSVSEQLTVHFETVPNVTGYEIKITGPQKNGVVYQTTFNSFTIEDLKNYKSYTIAVQSANQEWRSGWSSDISATPKATRKPPAVDMVVATPTFSGIDFGWKDMDDTLTYNLYYRKVGDKTFTKVPEINGVKYNLRGLEPSTEYEAYVTGNNPLGEGSKSQTVKATTKGLGDTIVPQYKLINTYNGETGLTNHIKEVRYSQGVMSNGQSTAMVDGDFLTYWRFDRWNLNTYGYDINFPITVLDRPYTMDEFVLTVPDDFPYFFKSGNYSETASDKNDTIIYYWNGEDTYTASNYKSVRAVATLKQDENGRNYYVLKTQDPITADAIQLGLTMRSNAPYGEISEIKFYEYDSLVDEVAALFKDDLRIELADGVNQSKIDELRERADIPDKGEFNPYRDLIISDLNYAEKILHDEKINDVITLNPNISNYYNGHLGFAMTINDYQPLGIVAKPGDEIAVYVGSNGATNIQVVFTQYYAEANTWNYATANLQKGQNIITVPKIGSASDERGGSVYIRYTSKPDVKNPIKIRVSGGTKIPVLEMAQLTTEEEKKAAIRTYITELKDYVDSLEGMYANSEYAYNPRTSVLASTEIGTELGLWSVSAVAVQNALEKSGEFEQQVERLYETTEAFDEMMELFYRHKGLSKDASVATDEMPKARSNIRYMRMFDGAFMYAGGYHIGIEYDSIAGLISANRNSEDKTGYFGWGISHEVGHQINQGNIVHAEVTNNVYALLAQTSNDKDISRLEASGIWDKVYDKVTSHTLGKPQNVFVTLAMYWQLHLAYDNQATFTDNDSIFAKIDRQSRTYKNEAGLSKDELLILWASKAAGKDLRDYFAAWGLQMTEKGNAELDKEELTPETKAIYYLNDNARRYRLAEKSAMNGSTKVTASIEEADSIEKRVTLSFKVNRDADKILGYEILRNGESIGFVQTTSDHEGDEYTFTDNVGSVNNRAFTYSVIAYDYLLNETEETVLEEVKISHDGSVMKDTFTATSNVKNPSDEIDFEDADMDYSKLQVNNLLDGDIHTGFVGTEKIKTINIADRPSSSSDNGNAYVIINLNARLSLSGIKYRAIVNDGAMDENTITKYIISVSSDGEHWDVARKGTFDVSATDPEEIIYFMQQGTTSESQLWTYHDVSYVKIEADGKKTLSGAEIDLIAPPGDNVDIAMQGDVPVIGKLKEDYCYLEDGCNPENVDDNNEEIGVIKAGSVVIQGTYRGNPAFNIVTIGEANDEQKLFNGYQIIFAEVEEDKSVYEVAEGTWIYVMTEEEYEDMLQAKKPIRAYLYRVNDAEELTGQRITSTSKAVSNLKTYDTLPEVELDSRK